MAYKNQKKNKKHSAEIRKARPKKVKYKKNDLKTIKDLSIEQINAKLRSGNLYL